MTNEANNILKEIQDELDRNYEDCEYSSKGHFESAKYWRYINYCLMFSSIATLFLPVIDNSCLGQILTFLSGFITVILIFLNPQEKYLNHQNFGNKFLSLKNEIRVIRNIDVKNQEIEKLRNKLIEIISSKSMLNDHAPPIGCLGYRSAKKQIEEYKNNTYNIDKD